MALVLNGDGAIAGLAAGGLPDASVTQSDLASGVVGNGPAFSVSLSANQTSQGSGGWLRLQFNTKSGSGLFDTANCFDTTNYRFTPNVAGYYFINGVLNYVGATVNESILSIYKNGSQFYRGPDWASTYGTGVTALMYMNGSTDYIELYHYFNAGSNKDVNGSFYVTNFQGYMVRSA
jgi:hypothetical protein